jgi:N-methylhydantoinase A
MLRNNKVSGTVSPVKMIGVDTGGTFTDLVCLDGEELTVEKLASTPKDPSQAVLEGVARLGGAGPKDEVVHGTTVALNALLTGRVARTALVTNEGFQDLIEIGRQARPELYALHPVKTPTLIPRELRFELPQRSWPGTNGELESIRKPTKPELAELGKQLKKAKPDSIVICLLHSFSDPTIEQDVAASLKGLGIPITCSGTLLREYREFERFATGMANACLVPLIQNYIAALRAKLPKARLSILQSNGGSLPAERAAIEPARVLLSGPAGGVVGAARAAREAGLSRIVTLDMGGTSTDVAFHRANTEMWESVSRAEVAGLPIGLPALDIHTIGCGGGSIVRLDAGGILHVGPASAGADPGPVCHGKGDELTVTDAHVYLGHIAAGNFLGGAFELDVDAVARGFERLAKQLGCDARGAAQAVLEVARAAMRRAIGVETMQRGQDPKNLPVVAFGGAGGLQAAALAGALDLPGALVPALPGCLSAYGMATADAISDRSRTLLAPLASWNAKDRRAVAKELSAEATAELRAAGHKAKSIEYEYSLELRYRGQSFELAVIEQFDSGVAQRFGTRHEELYGWALEDGEIELVNLRVRALVRKPVATTKMPRRKSLAKSAIVGERRATFDSEYSVPIIDRSALTPGVEFKGPALIEEFSGTTLLPPDWDARVTAGKHLWLQKS